MGIDENVSQLGELRHLRCIRAVCMTQGGGGWLAGSRQAPKTLESSTATIASKVTSCSINFFTIYNSNRLLLRLHFKFLRSSQIFGDLCRFDHFFRNSPESLPRKESIDIAV